MLMHASLAFERILELLDVAVATRNGSQAEVRCPGHEDRRASLSIGVRNRGRPGAAIHCQAGCTAEGVLAAMGLEAAALTTSGGSTGTASSRDPIAIYSYANEDGGVLFEVGRFAGKKFLQRRPGRSDWKGGIGDVRRVLYRLPQVIEAVAAGRSDLGRGGREGRCTRSRPWVRSRPATRVVPGSGATSTARSCVERRSSSLQTATSLVASTPAQLRTRWRV